MAINIKLDRDRLSNIITVDEYLALIDGDVKMMVSILSKFVIGDDGSYLDQKEGRKLVGSLTIDELKETMEAFIGNTEYSVVPP